MGYWNSGLYGNDTTCDVRNSYEDILYSKIEEENVYEEFMKVNKEYIGSDEEPLMWYALADTMRKYGRLTEEVKAKALYWIEKKGGIDVFEEDGVGYKWEKTLARLKEKLELPLRKPKKIPREDFVPNPGNVGDYYAYRFHSKKAKEKGIYGKYIVLQKIGNINEWGFCLTQFEGYNKLFDYVPTIEEVKDVELLVFDDYDVHRKKLEKGFTSFDEQYYYPLSNVFTIENAKDYEELLRLKKNLTYMGNGPVRPNRKVLYLSWCCVYLFGEGVYINYLLSAKNQNRDPKIKLW